MNNIVATARTSKPLTKAAPPVLSRPKEEALQDPLKTGGLSDSLAPAVAAPVATAEAGASLVQPRQTAGAGGLVGTVTEPLAGSGAGVGAPGPHAELVAPAVVAPPAAAARPAPAAPEAVVAPEAARAAGGGKADPKRAAKGAKAPVAVVPVKAQVPPEVAAKAG